MPLLCARFTWSNFQDHPSLSKLNRFLISIDWDNLLSPVSVSALPRPGLDHTPILLKGGEVQRQAGPFPFKFQNMWLLHPRFVDMVRVWWEDLEVWGPSGQRFRLKLKGLQDKL